MAEFKLAEVLGEVSKLDTGVKGREQIQYIGIDCLSGDPKNFYSISGVEELAANIELVGLQQPLRVRPDPDTAGRYIISSGHRRFAALRLLVDEGKGQFAMVPCIVVVETVEESEALQELRLIYANSDTRIISGADLTRQAERVEMLLYQLKKEGHEFPGRMRDHVAEACKVSASKLARLKVIRTKLLEPRFIEEWEAGDLKEQSAYALAQMPPIMQTTIAELLTGKPTPPGRKLEDIQKRGMENYLTSDSTCPDVEGCTNGKRRLAHDLDPKNYSVCGAYGRSACCLDCNDRGGCRYLCPAAKEKVSVERAKTRAENKKTRDAENRRDDAIKAFWLGFGKRLAAACEGNKDILTAAFKDLDAAGEHSDTIVHRYDLGHVFSADYDGGKSSIDLDTFSALCRQLNVSADYLLGLADDPLTQAAKEAATND